MSKMPDLIQSDVVRSQLSPGEYALWASQESRGRALSRLGSSLLLPLVWISLSTLLLFFALTGRIQSDDPDNQKIIPYFLGGFVLVGIFLLVRTLRQFWQGGGRIYVVTNQAALIVDAGPPPQAQRFDAQALQTIEVKARRDGSGDLVFDRRVHYYASTRPGHRSRSVETVGFLGTSDAVEAYRLIQKIPGVGVQASVAMEDWASQPEAHSVRVLEISTPRESPYAIFLTGTAICGARLKGNLKPSISDLMTASPEKIARWGQEGWLADYRGIDPLSQQFLDMDAENFRIQRHELQKIILREAYHTYRGDQRVSGQMIVHLNDNRQRKFVLLGDQNVHRLAAQLRTLTVNVEMVSDNPAL